MICLGQGGLRSLSASSFIYMQVCICMCVYLYVYIHVCVYVYVCVGVYVQIHMYIFEGCFFLLSLSVLFCVPYSCLPTVSLEVDVQTLKPSPELGSMQECCTKK